MIVQTGERKYRVQFVHSAHDISQSRAQQNPGSLRQFVDNMALSLRRRVTLAEIALIEDIPAPENPSETLTSFVPVSQGFSLCHYADQFVKSHGRGRALLRALKYSGLSRDEQDQIVYSAGFVDVETLRAMFSRPLPTTTEI